jgi:hypothetical protein
VAAALGAASAQASVPDRIGDEADAPARAAGALGALTAT